MPSEPSSGANKIRYRKLSPRVWRDEKFVPLTPTQKLVTLYALTGPQANRIGLFVFSPAMAAEDLGLDLHPPTPPGGVGPPLPPPLRESFAEAFEKVRKVFSWGWDAGVRVLFLPKWFVYNPPEGANNLTGNLKDLAELPQTLLIKDFAAVLRLVAEPLGVPLPPPLREGCPDSSPKPSRTQEQEQEQEQEHTFSAPPSGSEGKKPTKAKKAKKAKPESPPRNLLFDAVAEVTGFDPATAGGLLGSVAATLARADPPYTPDEVREFGRRFGELCQYAAKDNRHRPEPKELERHIGKLRSAKPQPAASTLPYD